jgi:hypothetical protein
MASMVFTSSAMSMVVGSTPSGFSSLLLHGRGDPLPILAGRDGLFARVDAVAVDLRIGLMRWSISLLRTASSGSRSPAAERSATMWQMRSSSKSSLTHASTWGRIGCCLRIDGLRIRAAVDRVVAVDSARDSHALPRAGRAGSTVLNLTGAAEHAR